MNNFRVRRLVASSIALLTFMSGLAHAAADVEVKETVLGSTHQLRIKSLTPSPDGKRLAYVISHGKKAIQLVIDGKPDVTDYDGIAEQGILFSPDSKRVAFLALAGTKWVVVIDGTVGQPYNTYVKGSLAFSPDSARWLVAADSAGKRLLLVDGKPGKTYDDIINPHFSPDGKRVAYVARTGSQYFAVIDGVQSPAVDAIIDNRIIFTPDGKQTAYAARSEEKFMIVSATGEPKPFDAIIGGTLTYSSDGKRLAAGVAHGANYFVIDNAVEGKPFDRIVTASLAFSPDGQRLAYVAERDGKMLVVVDGKEESSFDVIETPPVFSGDSKHLAYVTHAARSTKRGPKEDKDKPNVKTWTVIVDGKPAGAYDRILSSPIFSAVGARLALVVIDDRHLVVVADTKESAAFDEILEAPVYSSDGKRIAYAGRRGKEQFAVIDGVESEPNEAVGKLTFSPDGAHIAYEAQTSGDLHIHFDAAHTPGYSGVIHGAGIVFDGPSSLDTQVYRVNELLSVHVKLAASEGPKK